MVKIQRIKLTRLECNELQEREMRNLVGGQSCGCGCHYAESQGGSAIRDNMNANSAYGYTSYGGDVTCSVYDPDSGGYLWQATV